MIQIKQALDIALDKQYPCPDGIMGRIAGELMVHQHKKETSWTITVADIQTTDHILEIGFGAGKAIKLLAKEATKGSVAGIDLSTTMVKRARERNTQAIKNGRVTLQHGNATQLPFEDQQFDKVICIHTFYFWSDPLTVLTEIFRVLKPGGWLVLTLTTGQIEAAGETNLLPILEEQVLPEMQRIGFLEAKIQQGPLSRQFNILAVMGVKPISL